MKVKFFEAQGLLSLEREVNKWIEQSGVRVVNVSFCIEKYGYNTTYYCSVLYN